MQHHIPVSNASSAAILVSLFLLSHPLIFVFLAQSEEECDYAAHAL